MFDQSNPIGRFLRRFDFFPKYESEIIVRTGSGGIGTSKTLWRHDTKFIFLRFNVIFSGAFIGRNILFLFILLVTAIAIVLGIILLLSETHDFIWRNREDTILVDLNRDAMMSIQFDIVFPGLSCDSTQQESNSARLCFPFLSPCSLCRGVLEAVIDAVDETGETHAQAVYEVKKIRIKNNGEVISAAGAVVGDKSGKCMPCFTTSLHPWYVYTDCDVESCRQARNLIFFDFFPSGLPTCARSAAPVMKLKRLMSV
jgi:hypothetical protein